MANISYKINGSHNPKGINNATASLAKLQKAASQINTVVKGFVVAKVFQGINTVVKGSTDSFLAQNQALQRFNVATKLSNTSLEEMVALKNQISNNNFFDDDSLNNAIVLAEQMGLAEDQIKNVMKAATDLSASGVMPLDQAVKSLAQSYSGTSSTISKLCPEIKELSKEQLANGEAIEIIKSKYDGFAETMSNTFTGRNTQFKNTFSDLQSAVGGIIQGLKFVAQGTFLEPLNKITAWITENRDKIIAFVLNIPEITKVTMTNVWEIVKATFTGDGIKNLFIFLGEYLIHDLQLSLKTIWGLIKMLFDDLLALGDLTFGNLFKFINNKIMGIGNALIETINTALAKILDSDAVQWIAEHIFKSKFDGSNAIKFRFEEKHITTLNEFTSRVGNNTTTLVKNYKDAMKTYANDQLKTLNKFTNYYKPMNEKLVKDLQTIFNSMDIPDDLKIALGTVAQVLPDVAEELQIANENEETTPEVIVIGNSASEGNSGEQDSKNPLASMGDELLNALGELGSYISAAANGGWQAVLVKFLAQVIEKVQKLSPAFYVLLNCVSMLLDEVINEVVPAFDAIGETLLNIWGALKSVFSNLLGVVGSVVGVVAKLLNFVTELIAAIAPALNAILSVIIVVIELIALIIDCLEPVFTILIVVIKAIATVITVVANTISNILTAIYNAVIFVYNLLNGWGKDKDYKSYKSLDTGVNQIWNGFDNSGIEELLAKATSQSGMTSSTSTTNSSASYTAARDIICNNNFYAPVVSTTDFRSLCIMIRDTIRDAEKLGY